MTHHPGGTAERNLKQNPSGQEKVRGNRFRSEPEAEKNRLCRSEPETGNIPLCRDTAEAETMPFRTGNGIGKSRPGCGQRTALLK